MAVGSGAGITRYCLRSARGISPRAITNSTRTSRCGNRVCTHSWNNAAHSVGPGAAARKRCARPCDGYAVRPHTRSRRTTPPSPRARRRRDGSRLSRAVAGNRAHGGERPSRGIVCAPTPPFFSDAQLAHLVRDAGLDTVITDQASRIALLASGEAAHMVDVAGRTLSCFSLRPARTPPLPHGTVKITYTSGTTGEPKGVCLTAANIEHVMRGLCEAVHANAQDQSLALLPLSTLLANIANLYAPLSSGGTAWLAKHTNNNKSNTNKKTHNTNNTTQQRYR